MKIALITGHDFNKRGATETVDGKEVAEFNFNNALINDLKLSKNHYKAFFRDEEIEGYSGQMDELHCRLELWGCELAIEFHVNGFSDKSVDGHEVLAMSSNSMKYAEKLNSCFARYLVNNNRGAKKITSGDGYGFLSRGSYPCIISEPFFISHVEDYLGNSDARIKLLSAYECFINNLGDKNDKK